MIISFERQKGDSEIGTVEQSYSHTDIKVDKRVVGYMAEATWGTKDGLWRVRIAVKQNDKEEKCSFRWVTLTKRFHTELEARAAVVSGLKRALEIKGLELYFLD